jgi:MFS family permease
LNAIARRLILECEMTFKHPTSQVRSGFGFAAVAFAFTAVMAFTTVPTPLWSLFAGRDRFSSFTVTLVFAVYAVAVALSLFLVGHLSDWHGRRRVLAPALALNVLAGVVFVVWPQLPGLVLGRVLSGLGIGAVTATATAWLEELRAARHPGERRDGAQVVAITANLGGLGLGGLISGVLAQFVGEPLTLPFEVLTGALVLAGLGMLAAPETEPAREPRPRYHPQRVEVPDYARGRFFAAAIGAAIAFSLFGLVTSLAPTFLAGTLHEPSHALAGAVSFAMFTTAALAQTLTPSHTSRHLLATAIPALLVGIGLLALAVWLPAPSLAVFLAGDLIAGAGAGLMFKGAIGTAAEISLPEHRAETLAGLYLAAYLGLAGPVIGLGALTQIASVRVSLLAFAGALALGTLAAAPALLGGRRSATDSNLTLDERRNDADDSTQDDRARPDRPGDHAGRVRRVSDRRRRLGVRRGCAGG